MKHTKNMIIKRSPESEELSLYIINDGYLHEHHADPIIKNLQKKYKAGKFDKEKAIDAFYYLADAGAKKYAKEFSHPDDEKYIFDVTCRYTTAADLLNHYLEQITE